MFFKLNQERKLPALLLLAMIPLLTLCLHVFFDAPLPRKPFLWSKESEHSTEKRALYHSEFVNESCNMQHPTSHPLQLPETPDLHKQIKDYVAFHAKERACLLNYSCQRVPRILVATCSRRRCLGLGDRMRGLLFSFTIALITKRVLFFHKLGEIYPLESGLAPLAVDWTLPSTVIFNGSWPHLEWQFCRKGRKCDGNDQALTDFENFDNVGPGINMLTDDIRKVFGDRLVATISSRSRYSRLRFIQENPHLKDKYGDLAKYLLEKKMTISRLMFQPALPVNQFMKPVEFNEDYISVHIRTGVDAKELNLKRFSYRSTHEEETVERAFQCMKKVAKNMTKIFLASDSVNTKEIFKRKAKEMGYEVHLFEKETIHYSKAGRGREKNDSNDLCEGFLTVFADLFMLSRGKVMIQTGSHFSGLASSFARDQRTFSLKRDSECDGIGTKM